MDPETFRRTYRITTVRGRIVAQAEIWRAAPRSLAKLLGVTRADVYAVLDDSAWMARYAGQIPTRVGEAAVFAAHEEKIAGR